MGGASSVVGERKHWTKTISTRGKKRHRKSRQVSNLIFEKRKPRLSAIPIPAHPPEGGNQWQVADGWVGAQLHCFEQSND